MKRKKMTIIGLGLGWLAMAGVSVAGFRQNPISSPVDDALRKDLYAVYSAVVKAAGRLSPVGQVYLIEAQSFEFSPAPCAQAISTDPKIQQELQAIKLTSIALAPEFDLDRPYKLISAADAKAFLADAEQATSVFPLSPGTPPQVRQRLDPLSAQSRMVFRLGDVHFNQSRTLALVWASWFTSTTDMERASFGLSKRQSGSWEISGRTCGLGRMR